MSGSAKKYCEGIAKLGEIRPGVMMVVRKKSRQFKKQADLACFVVHLLLLLTEVEMFVFIDN